MADTRPLSSEHFRRLWLANIVTVVGAQLTVVAVPAQIYEITGSSAYVGLTGLFGLVPLVIFGLYGGALADVMDRRTLLDRHHPRPDPHQCGVLAAGRARSRERVAAPGTLLGAAGVLRRQPADAERDPAQAGAARPAARGQLAEHDGVPGRRHRRPAGRWRPDPRARLLVALPGGHGHAAGHPVRGGEAAEAAGRVAHRPGGLAVGDRRVPLPARPPGAAHVVPRRHHRDGLRDAARAVPGSRPRRLRRTRERWPRLRAAVRRHPCRRRARRDLLRLGLARRAAGSRGDRRRSWCGAWRWSASAWR